MEYAVIESSKNKSVRYRKKMEQSHSASDSQENDDPDMSEVVSIDHFVNKIFFVYSLQNG